MHVTLICCPLSSVSERYWCGSSFGLSAFITCRTFGVVRNGIFICCSSETAGTNDTGSTKLARSTLACANSTPGFGVGLAAGVGVGFAAGVAVGFAAGVAAGFATGFAGVVMGLGVDVGDGFANGVAVRF